jgi:hypothetical protein
MKASRDRFANLLHRPTELARRYHTMISTWLGDASLASTLARAGVLRAAGSRHDFTCYIDVDDPEPAQTCRRRLGSVTLAQLARPTKSSEGTAWQMQLWRT